MNSDSGFYKLQGVRWSEKVKKNNNNIYKNYFKFLII